MVVFSRQNMKLTLQPQTLCVQKEEVREVKLNFDFGLYSCVHEGGG